MATGSGTEAHFLMKESPVPSCSPGADWRRQQHPHRPPPEQNQPHAALQPDHPALCLAPVVRLQLDSHKRTRPQNGTRPGTVLDLPRPAMHGLGVPLIPTFLIRDELDSWSVLIYNALPHSFESDHAYHLGHPERKPIRSNVQRQGIGLCKKPKRYQMANERSLKANQPQK